MINVERGIEQGIDVTRIDQPESLALSVQLVFPHSSEGFSDSDPDKSPTQTVHLLEHVSCCGGPSSMDANHHRRLKSLYAAYSNAFTDFNVPGSTIHFEAKFHATRTPDEVVQSFMEEATPALRSIDVEQQKAVIATELSGYIAQRDRQIMGRLYFERGQSYGNDVEGLRRLPDITPEHMKGFTDQFDL